MTVNRAQEKTELLDFLNHRIEWLLGASPITNDIMNEITICKVLKFILEGIS